MGTRSALGRTTATSEAASQESLCSGRTPPETSAAPASAWQTARRESPGVPSQDSRAANRRKNRQPLPRSFPRQFGSRLPPQDARSASAPPPAAPPRFLSPHPKASPSAPAHESPRPSETKPDGQFPEPDQGNPRLTLANHGGCHRKPEKPVSLKRPPHAFQC